MNAQFDQNRSDTIREGLVEVVHETTRRRLLGSNPILVAVGLVLAGAVVGAAASAAAVTLTSQDDEIGSPDNQIIPELGEPVDAPPGVLPGEPIISLLGQALSTTTSGDATIDIATRPVGTTHARVTVTPTSAGSLFFGTADDGNNPSVSYTEEDVQSGGQTYYDFPLDDSTVTIYIDAAPDVTAIITIEFLNYVPTKLGVNDSGDTYGTGGPGSSPDLIAVTGTGPGGGFISGYVYASDLNAFSPDHEGLPANPNQALEWQAERDVKYPNGWDIPVFDADGQTVLGSFHIG